MYQYKGKITNVVDGDTVDIDLDLGFDIWVKTRFRLNGIDCAEHTYPFGRATKGWLTLQLTGKSVVVNSFKHDKYGRWLADIFLTTSSGLLDVSVNQQMINAKIAKAYKGDSKSNLWSESELLYPGPITTILT